MHHHLDSEVYASSTSTPTLTNLIAMKQLGTENFQKSEFKKLLGMLYIQNIFKCALLIRTKGNENKYFRFTLLVNGAGILSKFSTLLET